VTELLGGGERPLLHVPAHHFLRVDAEERLHTAEQEVGNDAERVQVGPRIDLK
jgi:hypothetical protein